MTLKESNHIEAAEAGLLVLDDNHSLWTGQVAWENLHTALIDKIDEIHDTDNIGVTDNTGAATSKKTMRIANGNLANEICGPLKQYFAATGDDIQGVSVGFSHSQLTYASETALLARWRKVHDVAVLPLNAAFFTGGYGVTTLMTAALATGISSFVTAAPAPKAKRALKTTAKADLTQEFKDLAKIITGIINLSQAKIPTHKSFVDALKTAFGIDDSGGREINAIFTLRDLATNVALKGIKLTLTKGATTFSQLSTELGLVTVKGKAQGNWTLLIEGETYLPQTIPNIPFDPEKPILKQTIKLVKA